MEQGTPKRELVKNTMDEEGILNQIDKFTAIMSKKAPSIKDFAIIKPISRGAFGKVFLGYKIVEPKNLFAIKVMRKYDMINKNMISQVITERNALALSRSPFCVNLYYSLQTASYIYLVMEYMIGGDLKSLLAMAGYFDESTAMFYCAEITLALNYLHNHGIVHRDIKPDNMLVSATGHVKLTDFGLSKIDLRRDLELSDLMNCSPNLNARTPGQLLSLTSHLFFGSVEKQTINKSNTNSNKEFQTSNAMKLKSSESDLDISISKNDSQVSGISPFLSADDIIIINSDITNVDTSSSYYTCNSSVGNKNNGSNIVNKSNSLSTKYENNKYKVNSYLDSNYQKTCGACKENNIINYTFNSSLKTNSKVTEDSGISSRKSELSANIHCEMSAIELNIECSTSLDISKSYNQTASSANEIANCQHDCSSLKNQHSFQPSDSPNNKKKKRTSGVYTASTGLTQEIDILDIGSSTPKKRKARSPLKGVLKIRSLSDDETNINERLNLNEGTVIFSTPVSSQKQPRGGLLKLKATRFVLPSTDHTNENHLDNLPNYLKMGDESPINTGVFTVTPKTLQTPFRTPKSVRRAEPNSERILGTPDYLSPELLLSKGHGAEVDWWALGVCLYEFMTGIPPFNDDTPQKVFDNILNRNIEWPQDDEALSNNAVEAVEEFLTMDPHCRPIAKDVQKMKFFQTINWPNLEKMKPPFIPKPDNPTDTGYFEARNMMQHLKLSSFDIED